MTHPCLRVEHSPHGFRRLLLACPQRHNPLDVDLARALRDAFAEDPGEPAVLGSTGAGVFCAGADLGIGEAERAQVSALLYECLEIMITRPGPVVAAVGGPAVAGGAQLATAADLRIAGPAARFRWVGPPGRDLAVGAWVLPDLVGRGRAAELAMTGRWVDAAEALALGLVNRVEPEPLQAAEEVAAVLAAGGAGSAARVKMIMAAGGLLDRLHAEQRANNEAWAETLAPAPAQDDVRDHGFGGAIGPPIS
jgi:enoyl-CoA hydratase